MKCHLRRIRARKQLFVLYRAIACLVRIFAWEDVISSSITLCWLNSCSGFISKRFAATAYYQQNPNVLFLIMDSDRSLDGNQAVSHQERQTSPDSDLESTTSSEHSTAEFAPINDEPSSDPDNTDATKPEYERRPTEDDLERGLSHRRSGASGNENDSEEWAQIRKLVSRMFGHERKAHSEEEKTRHVGVVWKNLTVKGVGLGSVLQPTNLDILLGIPRKIKRLLTRGRKGAGAGKPTRTIIDDFTVCYYVRDQGFL